MSTFNVQVSVCLRKVANFCLTYVIHGPEGLQVYPRKTKLLKNI